MEGFHGRSYGIVGKCKNAVKCKNATLKCVIFLEAVLFGFNYWNYILKPFFREITLIIIQTNKLTATVQCILERNVNFSVNGKLLQI